MTYAKLLLSAAAVLSLVTTVQAQTVNQRLNAVERKTDYFAVSRMNRSKTWRHRQSPVRNPAQPPDSSDLFFPYSVTIGGTDPVIVNAWITVTGNYDTDADRLNLRLSSQGLTEDGGGNTLCAFNKVLPTGQGSINFKVFCEGAVNPQFGEFLATNILVSPPNGQFLTVDGLTVSMHIVNQVITEPPQ